VQAQQAFADRFAGNFAVRSFRAQNSIGIFQIEVEAAGRKTKPQLSKQEARVVRVLHVGFENFGGHALLFLLGQSCSAGSGGTLQMREDNLQKREKEKTSHVK